ncbi:hypothetical protein C8P63_1054 [Melghirimyces profundicolus]|uniref:YolD-like protein n=1 Tax=Melghirimyces profundicolus TaxID=1242148 RepID=A0A2T6C264_9BACL|nr:hypothetical protein [Melghirimyces profundicolus]PTX62409.1 hypothetical protein C8P63_1054 [Melghirimyces profundicolus]
MLKKLAEEHKKVEITYTLGNYYRIAKGEIREFDEELKVIHFVSGEKECLFPLQSVSRISLMKE